jgi:hypothetical protein
MATKPNESTPRAMGRALLLSVADGPILCKRKCTPASSPRFALKSAEKRRHTFATLTDDFVGDHATRFIAPQAKHIKLASRIAVVPGLTLRQQPGDKHASKVVQHCQRPSEPVTRGNGFARCR